MLFLPTSKNPNYRKNSNSPSRLRLKLAGSFLDPGNGRVDPPPCGRGLALQLRLGALRQIGGGALDLLLGSRHGRGGAVRGVVDPFGGVGGGRGDGVGCLVGGGGDLRRGLAVLCWFFEVERERERGGNEEEQG